ncbi:putative pyroglutamyl peptidase type I [Pestalotiopsis sp. NC0098]|nr:putative pyroglutamyl peptidase type I [Pestalotiopsis sp. NC0098]
MGSIDSATRRVVSDEQGDDEFRVLITGFGPFKEGYPINPSWEIASSLPDYLPWDRVKDPARRTSPKMPRVRLLVHKPAVRVSYDTVRELVPRLWDGDEEERRRAGEEDGNNERGYDLALHIGMAGPPVRYSIERRGHRDGYRHRDVDGKYLDDDKRREREGDDWVWHGVPSELLTDLDIEGIYEKWVGRCPDNGPELRISEDPGHYLCDFIYFTSLAHLYKQHRPRNVLFLHVPASGAPESVRTGTELATQLLRAMVESEVEKRSKASEAPGL